MTIEERITNEFNSNFDNLSNPIKKSIVDDIKSLVIRCCKEQRDIDIERAVEILKATGYFQDEEFREEVMIDQFVKAMKGE